MSPTLPATTRAEEEIDLLSGWRYHALMWSVLLAALGYLGFALWSGWQDVANAVGRVGATGILVALLLSLVNYGLRFIRWQAYLRALNHPMPGWESLKIYLSGFALTTTPGKAGEMLRAVLLKPWGVPYPKSLAAFFSERLSDLVSIVALTLFGLTVYPSAQPLIAVGAAAVFAAYLAIANQRLLQRLNDGIRSESRIAASLRQLMQILMQIQRCHSPVLLIGATVLSLIAWAAEALAFFLILQLMGIETSLQFAVFVYAISMLAGALSFMPGGLGGTEGAMVALLTWAGAGSAEAVAATVVIRLATLWFAVSIGAAMVSNPSRSGARRNLDLTSR